MNLDALRNALDESMREGVNKRYDESDLVRKGRQAVRRAVLSWWLAEMSAKEDGLRQYVQRESKSNDTYDPNVMAVVFSIWNNIKGDSQGAQRSKEYGNYACAYIGDCLNRRGPLMLKAEVREDKDWAEWRKQIEKVSNNPDETYKKLVGVQKRIQSFLEPFDGYPCNTDARPQFQAAWERWDKVQAANCQRIFENWAKLRPEALQSARQSLLDVTPDRFLGNYFVSSSSASSVASPDCFWRHLAVTSLELFADAVTADVDAKAREAAAYKKKFPLDSNGEDLTAEDVGRLHEISRQLRRGGDTDGTIGAGAGTDQKDIDTLLERLRKPAVPVSLAQDVNVLPPPDGRYWCKVMDTIKMDPERPFAIRKIVIGKGSSSVECRHNSTGPWVVKEKEDKPLTYDYSKDDIEMTFFGGVDDEKPMEIREPKPFPKPWPWHRMLKDAKYDESAKAYVFQCVVTTQKREKIKVEIPLRFFKERDHPERSFKVFSSVP